MNLLCHQYHRIYCYHPKTFLKKFNRLVQMLMYVGELNFAHNERAYDYKRIISASRVQSTSLNWAHKEYLV